MKAILSPVSLQLPDLSFTGKPAAIFRTYSHCNNKVNSCSFFFVVVILETTLQVQISESIDTITFMKYN